MQFRREWLELRPDRRERLSYRQGGRRKRLLYEKDDGQAAVFRGNPELAGRFGGDLSCHEVQAGGMQLLMTDFCGFFALLGGCDAFLRFKANLDLSSFGSEGCELAQAFVEGALVGGLVAHIEGELFFLPAGGEFGVEREALEREGALHEPVMLGHVVDEQLFSWGRRLVFGAQIGNELLEVFFALPGESHELAGEAMTPAILRDGGFAFLGLGTTG